jgi:hypothetical protein
LRHSSFIGGGTAGVQHLVGLNRALNPARTEIPG